MTPEDSIYRFCLCAWSLAEGPGSVRAACRTMRFRHSRFYRWKRQAEQYGLELLRVSRPPRMTEATSSLGKRRMVAFALGHPGFDSARVSAELPRHQRGGIRLSAIGAARVLKPYGLNVLAQYVDLDVGYAAAPEPALRKPRPEGRLEASRSGELMAVRLFPYRTPQGTKGTVWQYTVIVVAAAHTWTELHSARRLRRQ